MLTYVYQPNGLCTAAPVPVQVVEQQARIDKLQTMLEDLQKQHKHEVGELKRAVCKATKNASTFCERGGKENNS